MKATFSSLFHILRLRHCYSHPLIEKTLVGTLTDTVRATEYNFTPARGPENAYNL